MIESENFETRTAPQKDPTSDRDLAVKELVDLGILIPLDDNLHLYHGRAGKKDGEDWQVLPDYKSSNDFNVAKRPLLYASEDRKTAEDFASVRSSWGGYPMVHEIKPKFQNGRYLFDLTHISQPEERQKIKGIFRSLVLAPADGSPVSFEDRGKAFTAIARIQGIQNGGILSYDDLKTINLSEDFEPLLEQLTGSLNAKKLIEAGHLDFVLERYLDMETSFGKEKKEKYPLNLEYLDRFFEKVGIVGCRRDVHSGNLDRMISTVQIFDASAVNIPEVVQKDRERFKMWFGNLSMQMQNEQIGIPNSENMKLLRSLREPYANPAEIMKNMMEIGGYGKLFALDAGVWEGFTLAEHTETLLNTFEESFADRFPKNLLAPMRLALLTHDMGKPEAVRKGLRDQEQELNRRYADTFLTRIGTTPKLKNLILTVMGDGSKLIHKAFVGERTKTAQREVYLLAEEAAKNFYGKSNPSTAEINGIMKMFDVMQMCDGSAYTDMATTRKKVGNVTVRFTNAPSFNSSFRRGGLSGRKVTGGT